MNAQTDRIIHMLYDAAAAEQDWYETACEIGDLVGAGPIHLFLCSLETGRDYLGFLARGNPDFADEYLLDYAPSDFRVPRVMAHKPGSYIDERDYVSRDEAATSPIHQDFLPRQEIYNISGANLTHDGCIGWFGLSTRGPGDEFDDHERGLLSLISGHVFRAVKLYRNRLDLMAAQDLSARTLDLVATGIVILAGPEVIQTNAAFDRLLQDRFFLVRNGGLTCADAAQAAQLQLYLSGVIDDGGPDCLVLRHREGGVSYLVQCHDLPAPRLSRTTTQAHRAVSIVKLDLDAQPDLEQVMAFCDGFCISRAEALAIHAVLGSQPLGAFAETRGIRLDTVHKQVKSAMRKTELNSQKKIFQAFERYRQINAKGSN
ncbi:helix-turn-helix transcriptional regulator [Hoeflea olei]|uniref:HTH luxR-type domain-containing protein n=1 Tax=Hoeflea olei TaxID=1480615 RepID=A0A1C1Z192_9HYPH|nr:hypothetical protein [Hoeflea olei]OCW59480.1 hypothetical protein AWJ14_10695 [Hoeflea olei]